MYQTSTPTTGRSQRVTCTGFANAVAAVAGRGKTFMVQAREATAGTSGGDVAANAQNVVMYVGEDGVGTAAHTGISLPPGAMVMVSVRDLSELHFRGANGDSVNIISLR